MFYDEAPYHVLYYPSQLDANRTDRFGGWRNQPSQNGNPLFGFGSLDYTFLTDAPVASPVRRAAGSGVARGRSRVSAAAPTNGRRRPRVEHQLWFRRPRCCPIGIVAWW